MSSEYNESTAQIKLDRSGLQTWGTVDYFNEFRFLETLNSSGAENMQLLRVGAGGVAITSPAANYAPPIYTRAGTDSLYCSGNVGIGTAGPGQKLEVGYYGGALSSDFGAISITNHATNLHATSLARFDISLGDIDSGTGSGNRKLIFNSKTTTTDSGTDILCLDGLNNNVGIGTASPAYKLHIRSGTASALLLESDNGGTGYPVNIDFRNYNTQEPPGARISVTDDTDYGSDIRFLTKTGSGGTGALSERMIIQGDGNVGIGTASPAYTLDVNGSLRATYIAGHGYITERYYAFCPTGNTSKYFLGWTSEDNIEIDIRDTGWNHGQHIKVYVRRAWGSAPKLIVY